MGSTGNPILDYVQLLTTVKKGLPFGQPVCVLPSHAISTTVQLAQLASELGPHIAFLQVQAENIEDWGQHTIDQLSHYAKKHGFILWEGSQVLNSTVNFMGRELANIETRKALTDFIHHKYTGGLLRTAQWSGLAISWAPGVPYDQQEKDLLIPSLRKAARAAVAATSKTIQTEISAQDNETIPEDEEAPLSPPSQNGWAEFSGDNVGYALRKQSTISVTESVTMQPHVETDEGIPPPPLLARGMTLFLPCSVDTAFTHEFRQSTIAAACANSDFVAGFTSSEPFFLNYRGNNLLELAYEDGRGIRNEESGDNLLNNSPYMDQDFTLALFSLIPPEILRDYYDNYEETLDKESKSEHLAKLFFMMDRAMKMREASRKERESEPHDENIDRSSPGIFQVPVVILP
ncbi:uncharacterized protein N7484_002809 [Penicillium longicatenatum]|uniref:uncharacterized protein n=1 Tax=Penicillium longicatenatum TaxID=1561947 RepID=UPI002548F731|nr:uncharacterized protein N7484_002809 [Penicillium longicatenatum]KAJ5649086.1 hypothetical protein N7484_002809 [Penicillium longicatenatum]